MHRITILFCLIMLIAACREPNGQTTVPALLINPGVDTLQEIEQTISATLNGVNITLAPDVLTVNSVLIIQHSMQHSIDRPPELGRDLGQPYRFQLVTDGSACALVDMQSGLSWPLRSAKCVKQSF